MKKEKETQKAKLKTQNSKLFGVVAAFILLLAGAASAQTYSKAIGNRDPVSQKLACLCGCKMTLATCDHANCPGQHSQLDELAVLRSSGNINGDEEKMLDAMIAKYGVRVLAVPPAKGFYLTAWIVPFALIIGAAITLGLVLYKKTASAGSTLLSGMNPPDQQNPAPSQDDIEAVEKALIDRAQSQ